MSLKDRATIIVLGRSGSGKSVQVDLIMRRLGKNADRVETGDFLRALAKKFHPTALLTRRTIKAGRLVPGWLATFVWLRSFIERGRGDRHLVFDGAPRGIWEAELLDQVIAWHHRPPPVCIYVAVDKDIAIKRLLKRARSDDTVAAIKNRMAFFDASVRPVLRFYRRRGRFIRVNGNKSIDEVQREIQTALRSYFKLR